MTVDAPDRVDARLVAKARRALAFWQERAAEPTSNLLGTGAVAELERGAAEHLGCRFGLSLPSATLALRVALGAAGAGSGQPVLLAGYDWPAAAAAVKSLGAVAVAVDVELPGCGMDAESLDGTLRRLAGPVVVTHLFGVPARIDELADVCRSHGVPLIEDCSQALGATVASAPVGAFGDYAVCSFGPGKVLDTEDGGVVATKSRAAFERCVRLSQHPLRQKLEGIEEINLFTLALRLHPLAALVGVAELEDFENSLMARRAAMAELTRWLDRAGWHHAGRAGVEAVGPRLPAFARGEAAADDAASTISFAAPGQYVIGPFPAPGALPTPQAERADHEVVLAHLVTTP